MVALVIWPMYHRTVHRKPQEGLTFLKSGGVLDFGDFSIYFFFLILSLTFVGATQGSDISAQVLGETYREQFVLMVLVHSLGQEV